MSYTEVIEKSKIPQIRKNLSHTNNIHTAMTFILADPFQVLSKCFNSIFFFLWLRCKVCFSLQLVTLSIWCWCFLFFLPTLGEHITDTVCRAMCEIQNNNQVALGKWPDCWEIHDLPMTLVQEGITGPIPGTLNKSWEHTLDKMPDHHRVPCILIHT